MGEGADDQERQGDGDEDLADPPAPGDGSPSRTADESVRGVSLDSDEDEAFGATYGGVEESQVNPEAAFTRSEGASTKFREISREELREHYGPIRTYFKRREGYYTAFQHQLTQAWVSQTYDQYLARTVARMAYLVVACAVLGVVAAAGLLGAAQFGYVGPSVSGRSVGLVAGLVAGLSATTGAVTAGLYWSWVRVLRIRRRIASRRREINYNLPYAITFMYALARAGVNFDQIVTRLADATETYGAVGKEFERVVRDIEMFGNNLYVGLENLRAVTPSEELARFTDDVMTVLESGGDLGAFLRDEVETQLETAIEEQEAFVDRLELLSEVFVVGFVAAPLFVLVVLIVVSFLGAEVLPAIGVLVYAGMPLAMVGFGVLVDAVSQPFADRPVSFSPRRDEPTPPTAADHPDWWTDYQRDRRLTGIRDWVRGQLERVGEDPWRALLFAAPIALAVPVAGVLTGAVPTTFASLLANPVEVTTELAVAPLVIALTPVALVHEYRQRRERAFQRRFPDLLKLLATSNRRGLSLSRSLDIVADSASGRLAAELQRLRNDVRWNADLPAAFEALGDRLSSPQLTRTVNLIAEGSRVTSDLHVVLEVAATDTAERARLKRERRQRLRSYLVIVVIGFLVYLLVVLLLAANFLEPLEAFGEDAVAVDEGPISVGSVPVAQLEVVLFHSALIQGFGSGVLAGKLAENSLYGGLKYGIGLVVLAVVAFTVV